MPKDHLEGLRWCERGDSNFAALVPGRGGWSAISFQVGHSHLREQGPGPFVMVSSQQFVTTM